jgi:hypothetical protein
MLPRTAQNSKPRFIENRNTSQWRQISGARVAAFAKTAHKNDSFFTLFPTAKPLKNANTAKNCIKNSQKST